jgi:ATP synthase I chain.
MLTGPARVALAQAGIAVLLALLGFAVYGGSHAAALGYGAVVAWVTSLLLVRREYSAMRHPEWDGKKLFAVFMLTGLERLTAVVVLLALGLGVLHLAPLPVLAGLALAQFGWLAAASAGKKQGS